MLDARVEREVEITDRKPLDLVSFLSLHPSHPPPASGSRREPAWLRAAGFEPWAIDRSFSDPTNGRTLQCDVTFFRM